MTKAYTRCPLDNINNEPFFTAAEANDNEETIFKEDKTMSNKVITKKNVNANVKNNKEENEMTKATTKSIAKLTASLKKQLEAEHKNLSFEVGAKAPEKYACKNNLGMREITVKSIKYIDIKRIGDPDKGKTTKFLKAFKVETDMDCPAIIIPNQMFLYRGDTKVDDVDVYDAIVDSSGTVGYYFTVKKTALDKKVNELTAEDIHIHQVTERNRIWIPGRREMQAVAKTLGKAEIAFEDGEAVIPEFKTNIFVYEDEIMKKVKKIKDGKIKTFAKYEYYYNASFIAPEDQYDMKYGRRFTTSENVTRRKEIATLPGVVRYLESC